MSGLIYAVSTMGGIFLLIIIVSAAFGTASYH